MFLFKYDSKIEMGNQQRRGQIMFVMYHKYKVFEDGKIIGANGKQLATFLTDKGYVRVTLTIDGKRTTKHVHRILAECFLEKPDGCSEVDHIDGVRCNNSLVSLRWVTKEQNIQHSYDLGNKSVLGSKNPRAKVSEDTVHDICKLLQLGKSATEIRSLGYDYRLVRTIKSGQNWSHISKHYLTQRPETIESTCLHGSE